MLVSPSLKLLRYLSSLGVVLLVMLLYVSGMLQSLSSIGYDTLYKLRGPQPADARFLIVTQDDPSLEYYKIRLGDWPRSWHARLIDILSQAGAELIIFDYDFSQPTNPLEDDRFTAAIEKAGIVILANRLLTSGELRPPLASFAAGALDQGFINVVPDSDGRMRRTIYFAATHDNQLFFSLPLKIVEIFEDFPEDQRVFDRADELGWGEHLLPYPNMLINFSGPQGSFSNLPYFKVLEGDYDPAVIKGKIVLVGNTHTLGKDFFVTPTSNRMPGVEVLAHSAATILNDTFLRPLPSYLIFALIVGFGMIGSIVCFVPRITIRKNLLVTFVSGALVLGASYYLFVYHYFWLDIVPPLLVLFVGLAIGGLLQWYNNRRRVSQIKHIFGRYVSRNVVDVILSNEIPVTLESHRKDLSVLFSDIRGFTSISEQLSAVEVGRFLNRYFEAMIATVFEHRGTLDKLMGDAIMAFFGSPLPVENHALAACRCALEMRTQLEHVADIGIGKIKSRLEIGIGINSGEVIAGNLGSADYIDYTVIGDTVNLGARLESLNKIYGTCIIIGEDTYAAVSQELACRELDQVKVTGKDRVIRIYELLEDKATFQNEPLIEMYHEALECYRQQRWTDAQAMFKKLLKDYPNDGPANVLKARCRTHIDALPLN